MNYLKDIGKLVGLLGLLIAISWGIYQYAKKQDAENRKRYTHPVQQVGGQW